MNIKFSTLLNGAVPAGLFILVGITIFLIVLRGNRADVVKAVGKDIVIDKVEEIAETSMDIGTQRVQIFLLKELKEIQKEHIEKLIPYSIFIEDSTIPEKIRNDSAKVFMPWSEGMSLRAKSLRGFIAKIETE